MTIEHAVEPRDKHAVAPAGERSTREAYEQFRSVVANIPGVVYRCECVEPWTMHFISEHVEVLTGFPASDFTEDKVRSFGSVIFLDDREHVNAVVNEASTRGGSFSLEYRLVHANGTVRWVTAHGRVVVGRDGRPLFIDGVMLDLSEQKEADLQRDRDEAKLRHEAGHDTLTGLPNRTLILDRTAQMLLRSQRGNQLVGAFSVDLDNFKFINDTLGRRAGDELLKCVAVRFAGVMRASDTVGRPGGDEFVILAEGVSLAAGPQLLAERLMEALREPFRIDEFWDIPLSVSASIGYATNDRDSPHDLLRDADIAVRQAKARGKNCYVEFTPEMKSVAMDRLELEMDLPTALEENQLFLLYQPVFDLDTVNVCGVEALLRWRHPARGIVGPDAFVPMLEESGTIVPVGLWVLRQACRQAAAWRRLGHNLTMSVNVSIRQLETPEFVDHLREALASTAIPPASLIIEIAETSLWHNPDATIARLRQLKELGVLIAVDDFGTGYSPDAYLGQFPVDAVKIDRSFVAAMADSPESLNFVRTLVQLGRTLGLETTAEGIEQGWQLERLQHEQCEFGQGFLFSQPLVPEALEAILSLEALLS